MAPAVAVRDQLAEALSEYRSFLEAKSRLAVGAGFPCNPDEVSPALKPIQREIVAWAVLA